MCKSSKSDCRVLVMDNTMTTKLRGCSGRAVMLQHALVTGATIATHSTGCNDKEKCHSIKVVIIVNKIAGDGFHRGDSMCSQRIP